MKKKIVLSLVLGSIFVSGCSCSIKNKQNSGDNNSIKDNTIIITDENVVAPQDINGIIFENIGFQVQDGVTTVVTQYTNTTDSEFRLDNYQIIITDKDGMILTSLVDMVDQTLAPNDVKTSSMTFESDVSAAAKVDYEVNVEVPSFNPENVSE